MDTIVYVFDYNKDRSSNELIIYAATLFCKATKQKVDTPFKILKEEKGKPYFEGDTGIYFSVSHSGKYLVCVVSSYNVGIDIQLIKDSYNKRVSERFFNPLEQKLLKNENNSIFYKIWAGKESFVKYLGIGITSAFPYLSVTDEQGFIKHIDNLTLSYLNIDENYACCLTSISYSTIKIKRKTGLRYTSPKTKLSVRK